MDFKNKLRSASIMKLATLVTFCLFTISGVVVYAGEASPVGKWKTIDDKTGKERSIVTIVEEAGELKGTVEKIVPQEGDDPSHLCKECPGDKKDKPVIGMTIMWGLKKNGDVWSGGQILDPKNGKTYKCKLSLEEDGKKLIVRGYLGISLLGRSQTWHRVE